MDVEHCVIAVLSSEVAKFRIAADKRRYNVFFLCLSLPAGVRPARLPVALERGFGGSETTMQRYEENGNGEKYFFGFEKKAYLCTKSY